ncbi:MAG: hypothetical protein ACE362_23510 [Phaeodactylibacter xiamenensis]|uniref:hypothetical protein n=2 Tax=Phaeodactylibacter xiamenensis TaxID=1524460 RepID=UPI002A647D0A|nr:hypothetical protein [Gammaproteobacteria bacterium]
MYGNESLFSQDRDSLGLILNFRGSGNLLEEFNDYTGVSFSESALVRLQQEVSALDSADHEGFLFSPYEIMGQQYGINQPFLDSALIALNGAKKILFSVNNLGGYPEETVFSVDIVNPDLLISEVDGIEDELKYLMKASSINNEIPEVFALAIERYLDVINPAGLYQSYFENNLQVLLDDDTYPSFELDSIANFIALSGVPIKLPAGSRVKFLRFDDDQKGMLYCFRLPGNSYYHTPKKWKAGTSNAGKFAGYGYWSPADWNSSSKVIFYSYEDYLVHNGGCGFPPYTLGEVTEVLLGYTKGCPGNEGELYIYPRLYKTYFEDITSPESPDEGYPAYRAANENVTFADIDQHIINSTQQVFDDSCSQEVITLHHNQLLKDIPFPCGISSDLVPLSALSSGEYYFIHFDNGVEAVMSIHQGRQFLAYLDNDAELVVLEYDKFYGWFYSDFQGPQFSKDAGIILNFAGELALQAGITSVFIAVNVYLGGAVAAMAAPYGVETGALLLLDLAVSAGEASSVYMITDDSNLAMQAFFAGAVGSVGGTLLTNSIKGFRLTSSDDLDVLFKTRTYSEIPQDASASYMTKRLREFKSEVRSSGMSDDLFRTLLIDMESSDDLARYILSDYKRVRAWWEALYDLPNLRPQANWLEFVEEAVSTHGLKYRQAGLSAKAVSSTSSNWVTQNISDFDQLYADQ